MANTQLSVKPCLIAVVGNPNAGKTTLFNALTESFQKVGNYPGVTVEKISGRLKLGDRSVDVLDVPGLYSLNAISEDERVAVGAIHGRGPEAVKPDLLVVVLDASNLERNLFLWTQIAEQGIPALVALTMRDRMERRGIVVDVAKLAAELGVDVVPVVGHTGFGLKDLVAAIDRNLAKPRVPGIELGMPGTLERAVDDLHPLYTQAGLDSTRSEVRHALLTPAAPTESYLREHPDLRAAFDATRSSLESDGTLSGTTEASKRYEWTARVQKAVVGKISDEAALRRRSDKIDAVLTHRVFGLGVFALLMYLMFQSIYSLARPLMDGIQWVFDKIGAWIGGFLVGNPVLKSFVVDGLIGGVGSMLAFLPQIMILFLFIAVLEGTGYLARAAFLMDKLLGWCGLNGRAFIPLLSSFACAIPGIMSARVIPDTKSRLATILVAPLMSCSARLPVYLLLIGAFIEPRYGALWAGVALFGMHMVGLLVAIPIVWVLNRRVLRGSRLPFVLELPPYTWPKPKDVWLSMYFRAKVFVKTAGTIIVLMSAVIWTLSYFPRSEEAQKAYTESYSRQAPLASDEDIAQNVQARLLEDSYLGRFGKVLEPVFAPAGFDWRITTSILSAFPARETVVPSVGILFNLGRTEEKNRLQTALQEAKWPDGRPLMTLWNSIGLMVFFALCCQCFSTLATIRRETNSLKWPVFVFSYMTILAYIGAVLVNQLGNILGK